MKPKLQFLIEISTDHITNDALNRLRGYVKEYPIAVFEVQRYESYLLNIGDLQNLGVEFDHASMDDVAEFALGEGCNWLLLSPAGQRIEDLTNYTEYP